MKATPEPTSLKLDELQAGTVVVLGIPFEENSSFLRGTAGAPEQIRAVLHSGAGNLCVESGLDLSTGARWQDAGDLVWPGGPVNDFFARIRETVGALLTRGARLLTLGGDHSITYPIVQAYAQRHASLSILQLDAHPDLYDHLDGNRLSHASPFARIMEEKLAGRLVQVGVRALTPHQREQAERFGVEIIEMRAWQPGTELAFDGPVYLSIDMDCLDPAFAPGVSHHEPGGFTTRDLLGIIQSLKAPVVGADLVEFNPRRDPSGVTAAVAAKLVKEMLARMLSAGLSGRRGS